MVLLDFALPSEGETSFAEDVSMISLFRIDCGFVSLSLPLLQAEREIKRNIK
jgi:hypothetical protein